MNYSLENRIFSLFFCCLIVFSCQKNIKTDEDSKEIITQIELAKKYEDTLMQPKIADSLLNEAQKKALISDNSELIARSSIARIKYGLKQNVNPEYASQLFHTALENSKKVENKNLENEAYLKYSEYLLKNNKPNDALTYLNLSISTTINHPKMVVERLLLQSKINQQKNLPYEELRNLLDAYYYASDIENDSLTNASLLSISHFYFYKKKYQNALEYVDKLKTNIKKKKPLDSVAYYYAEANRLIVISRQVQNDAIPELAEKIYLFAEKKNLPSLANMAQSTMRTYYIDGRDFKSLENWYSKYPTELSVLKQTNATFYYRVKAYIAENHSELDSARYYFQKSAEGISSENSHFLYTHYLRNGDFEYRNNNNTAAIENYEKAYENILKTNSFFEQIQLGEILQNLYNKTEQEKKSQNVLLRNNQSKDHLINLLNDENVQDIELNNILKQKELERQKEQEKLDRKHNQQYLIIALLLVLVTMTLIMLSFYSVPEWWMKAMGYISFIMFFEFIILLIDGWLHHKTHGSPLLILGAKVIIIPFLIPIHHWVEKKFVNLLLKKNFRQYFYNLKNWKKNQDEATEH